MNVIAHIPDADGRTLSVETASPAADGSPLVWIKQGETMIAVAPALLIAAVQPRCRRRSVWSG